MFLYYKKFRTGLLKLEKEDKDNSYMSILKDILNRYFSI